MRLSVCYLDGSEKFRHIFNSTWHYNYTNLFILHTNNQVNVRIDLSVKSITKYIDEDKINKKGGHTKG